MYKGTYKLFGIKECSRKTARKRTVLELEMTATNEQYKDVTNVLM